MRTLLLLLLAASSCSLLPERVYTEVTNSPLADLHPDLGDFDEYAFTVGLEYDLKPQEVVISGQRYNHPWDLASAIGIYDEVPPIPTPLNVEDPDLRARVEVLMGKLEGIAEDVTVVRDATDVVTGEASSINRIFLGGGGFVGLLALLFGGRAYRRTHSTPKTED